MSDDPIDVEDDYTLGGDTNLHNQSIPTSSAVSKCSRGNRYGLGRLTQSFENTTHTITSGLCDNSILECKAVLTALRELPELTVEMRVKAADYYAKNKVSRQMFLECTPDERQAYVKLVL